MDRALYFQSKVPIQFKGKCVATTTYLINRVPSPLLNHKSPYQVLFGSRPDCDSLRTFGYLGFAATLPSTRNKFSPWVVPFVFVGYLRGYKGYNLYNIETKQFYILGDIIFHETIFLFHSNFVDQELPEFCNDYVIPLLIYGHSPSDPHFEDVHPTIDDSVISPGTIAQSTKTRSNPVPLPTTSSTRVFESMPPQKILRRSSRKHKRPFYLSNFIYFASSQPYLIWHYCFMARLSSSYHNFINQISTTYEPRFYHQAIPYPKWRQVMTEEI